MNYQKLAQWLSGDDTGLSSRHMAAVAAGLSGSGYHPLDGSDLGRCIRLVQNVPEIREAFPAIAASGPKWSVIIAHWDELVAVYEDERQGRDLFSAPKTHALMNSLGL